MVDRWYPLDGGLWGYNMESLTIDSNVFFEECQAACKLKTSFVDLEKI